MRTTIIPACMLSMALISLSMLNSLAPDQAVRQFVFFIVGFALFFLVSKIPFSTTLGLAPLAYLVLNALLIFTLLFAATTRGTARWISIGDFVLQPSQLAIPVTVLFITHFLRQRSLAFLKNFSLTVLFISIPAFLILIAPDLDTTIVFLSSMATFLWFSRSKPKHLLFLALVGVITATLAWFFVLQDYQKARFTSFLSGASGNAVHYNAEQALIAIGSGQLMGKGLGGGVQSYLRFLPERQTDFIFSAIGEEYGFIGAVTIILLYFILGSCCIYIGHSTQREEARLYCFTIAAALLIQAGVNISMNLSLIPIAGLTLPLISYGGSSVLATCCMLGLIQSVAKEPKHKSIIHLS